ncbi:NAD binding domain of 6-phosphogluconate dehydrogenase family protein [Mycolicibacterium hassiacum DSM 44199]|uniref:NAD binding domain of 6-phosphogluconate dehydrogenase family protein n=1 Tax=Mycolicibacterium hassiacum (strain DSM 44199 / CIP 105218 / JCM 12690 / 3849) TaxID=1122247 RepID=K5B7B8_MYCHD|nr:NAD(P)-dependent oxidoreductase [Mycolicibacterium hassiacum]EKF21673.1 NAD binding domain of 6-phosphogluconate dehydrogenase family protein [Mycolicibacterium hassiacum DSM 44199]MBX5487487.1 NAD(P)-dependent oxidoreductase [Mycolicibacterium hassiacum]MDA4084237.1 6-phosphogluconate dehydrogenase [Mycolicibacterium hassiacum DSM 44199]VCT91246.1 2-hydroxy-3-oxopropionate reductase [Mycolicibacterium hassiacum DSM 44199]
MSAAVGFIGPGQMGEPMVHRLLGAGHRVTVYARRDEVRNRLTAAGATVVDSAAGVAEDHRIIIVCLFSDDQLREVALGPDGLLAQCAPGTVVLSHTTGSVATLRELASARPEVTVLDAPISGTAEDIANGRLTVLIGGPADAAETAGSVVQAYASTVLHTGELGTALNLKLVNNVLFAANAQLLSAAVALAEDLDIEPEDFLNALAACSADSRVAGHVRGIGGIDNFTELAAPFLRKDVDAAFTAAKDAGTDLGLLYDVIARGPLPLTG